MQTALTIVGCLVILFLWKMVLSKRKIIINLEKKIKVKDGYIESLIKENEAKIELTQTQAQEIITLKILGNEMRGFKVIS